MLKLVTARTTAVLAMAILAIAAGPASAQTDYSRDGADTCFRCHDDQTMLAVFRTKHANPEDPRSPFGKGQLQCEACHGPGGDHTGRVRRGQDRPPIPAFGSNSTSPIEQQNGYCMECHLDETGFAWHGSEHDDNTVACSDCHTVHVERDPILARSTQAEVCFPHGDAPEQLLARSTVNGTCYDCHAEFRGPYLWEHAPVTEDCNSCHEPHGSNQPGMLKMRAPFLCQSCHSQAGHPSIPQDERGLPANAPSALLLGQSCLNCHDQVHGSNHPSGQKLMR
jgi:predicted CXXCH cytochrome family protein